MSFRIRFGDVSMSAALAKRSSDIIMAQTTHMINNALAKTNTSSRHASSVNLANSPMDQIQTQEVINLKEILATKGSFDRILLKNLKNASTLSTDSEGNIVRGQSNHTNSSSSSSNTESNSVSKATTTNIASFVCKTLRKSSLPGSQVSIQTSLNKELPLSLDAHGFVSIEPGLWKVTYSCTTLIPANTQVSFMLYSVNAGEIVNSTSKFSNFDKSSAHHTTFNGSALLKQIHTDSITVISDISLESECTGQILIEQLE